jgi:hypothetical protein
MLPLPSWMHRNLGFLLFMKTRCWRRRDNLDGCLKLKSWNNLG